MLSEALVVPTVICAVILRRFCMADAGRLASRFCLPNGLVHFPPLGWAQHFPLAALAAARRRMYCPSPQVTLCFVFGILDDYRHGDATVMMMVRCHVCAYVWWYGGGCMCALARFVQFRPASRRLCSALLPRTLIGRLRCTDVVPLSRLEESCVTLLASRVLVIS